MGVREVRVRYVLARRGAQPHPVAREVPPPPRGAPALPVPCRWAGTAPSRRPRPARDASPCSPTRLRGPSGRWRPAATGTLSRGASATPGGCPASARRACPPRGPWPAGPSSCSSRSCRRRGCAGGRAGAASTGTTRPGPPRRGGGDRAPRAGGPPPPRVRGHREAARHLRQAGLRVADHVITLREFREPLAISCQASPRLPSTHCLPTTSWQRHGVSSCQRWSNREKSIDEGFRHEINLA